MSIRYRHLNPRDGVKGSTGRARPGDGAGAAVAADRCRRRLTMHRQVLLVALGLGCLAIWFPPAAAARAATVTTASGSSATAAGSGAAGSSGTTAPPGTVALPATSSAPGPV